MFDNEILKKKEKQPEERQKDPPPLIDIKPKRPQDLGPTDEEVEEEIEELVDETPIEELAEEGEPLTD